MLFGSHVNAIVIYDIVIICDIFSFNHSIFIHTVPRATCSSRCALIIYMLYHIHISNRKEYSQEEKSCPIGGA